MSVSFVLAGACGSLLGATGLQMKAGSEQSDAKVFFDSIFKHCDNAEKVTEDFLYSFLLTEYGASDKVGEAKAGDFKEKVAKALFDDYAQAKDTEMSARSKAAYEKAESELKKIADTLQGEITANNPTDEALKGLITEKAEDLLWKFCLFQPTVIKQYYEKTKGDNAAAAWKNFVEQWKADNKNTIQQVEALKEGQVSQGQVEDPNKKGKTPPVKKNTDESWFTFWPQPKKPSCVCCLAYSLLCVPACLLGAAAASGELE